jgi:hypothetical protein
MSDHQWWIVLWTACVFLLLAAVGFQTKTEVSGDDYFGQGAVCWLGAYVSGGAGLLFMLRGFFRRPE